MEGKSTWIVDYDYDDIKNKTIYIFRYETVVAGNSTRTADQVAGANEKDVSQDVYFLQKLTEGAVNSK